MRNQFFCFALLLLTTLFSCSESETPAAEETAGYVPTLTANFDSLKMPRTHIDGNTGETSWSADDELLVFVHESGKQPTSEAQWASCRYKFVTDATHCIKNQFRQESNSQQRLKLNPEKSYDWYVMAPYSETVKSPVGHGSFSISDQTLDFDNNTAHLGAKDIMTSTDRNVKAEEKVTISLRHLTTLMMFRVHNKLGTDFLPLRMEFETKSNLSAQIAGKYAVDFEKGLRAINETNKMSLAFVNAKTVKSESYFDIYAIMNPFELAPNDQFCIRVITDKSNSLQTSTMRKTVTFRAGTINRANVKVNSNSTEDNIGPWENQGEYDEDIQM